MGNFEDGGRVTDDRVNTDEHSASPSLSPLSKRLFTRCAHHRGLYFVLGNNTWSVRQNTLVLRNNMEAAPPSSTAIPANEHVLRALQLNKDCQVAVKTQIEQLESKLTALNKLLVCATPRIPMWGTDPAPRLLQKSMKRTISSPN